MEQRIHLRPLLALRLLGALVGLVALALGVAVVRGIALVVTALRTIPVASLALIPPSDRPGLALLLTLCAVVGPARTPRRRRPRPPHSPRRRRRIIPRSNSPRRGARRARRSSPWPATSPPPGRSRSTGTAPI